MTSRSKFIKHLFSGGWATDYGPTAFVDILNGNKVALPWLNEAENVIYELDGGPHKMPGCTKNFSSPLESGALIAGVYDAWFSGSSGSPAQHRILNVGTKIKKDNGDNTFTDLFTGMAAAAIPCYCMLEDLLIMSNDSGTDVPKSWDGTTAQDLAGSPPTFAFSVAHQNYAWAAGDKTNPSRLYYSVVFTPDDWSGAGSGFIDIDPSDGDGVTGIISHRDELWVFKGPYKGSIHRISGTSPTGDDPFSRSVFVRGVGSVNHNLLISYANDISFTWSDGTVRTLSATNNFGNYDETTASQPINSWIRQHVNLLKLKYAQAVNWSQYGVILMAVPIDASTVPNCILMLDYRFSPPRWAKWKNYNMATSLAEAVDATASRRVIVAGGSDGILRTLIDSTRQIDGITTIPYNVLTPFLDYGIPERTKTLEGGSICFNPKSSSNVTFGWSRDGAPASTTLVSQGGGGGVLDAFLLDTDFLGGGLFQEKFTRFDENGGEFRSIQYQVLQNSADDVEIHSISAQITPSAESYEDA